MLKSEKRRVSVTAPTGIAALAIGGCTIHSWARVGLGQGSAHALYNKLIAQKHKSAKFERDTDTNRIWNTDVLIVDEISMVRAMKIQNKINKCHNIVTSIFKLIIFP
jgi:ATP-dependent DNA helicase PIF1